MPDDSELLLRYARHEAKDAFGELVQRHLGLVYQAALRQVGNPHQAEDVAQEVFSLLARKAPALVNHPVLIGWLFSTTRQCSWRLQRTERRRQQREHTAWEAADLHSPPTDEIWNKLKPLLDEVLEELKPAERDALLLRFFQEQPYRKIGVQLNLSEDAARMRVERALDKLSYLLAKRGVVSTSAALTAAFASQAGIAAAPAGLNSTIAAGVFSAAGSTAGAGIGLAKASFGLGKILAACTAGILAIGVVAYELKERHPDEVISSEQAPGAGINQPTPVPDQSANHPSALSENSAPAHPADAVQPKRADRNFDQSVDQLDRLVGLTAEQKTAAKKIFTDQDDAIEAFALNRHRTTKAGDIGEHTRAQIRAMLTPPQQKIYNAAPKILGGGSMNDAAASMAKIDRVVALTDAQTTQVSAIYQKEFAALEALTKEDREGIPAKLFRQTTKDQIRVLLTPEQQQKYDDNPNGAPDMEMRAIVDELVKNSPALAARLGAITKLVPLVRAVTSHERPDSMKGQYHYQAQGSSRSETLIVYWEKASPTAPIKIIRIKGKAGEVIL